MAGKTSKSAWTEFERWVAAAWNSCRNPLSGANNKQGDGSARPGDVILDGYDALIEAKFRASHAHHTLFKAAQEDAVKNGISPEHVFLYTHVKREDHDRDLVVMNAKFFNDVVVPILKPHLKREDPTREAIQKAASCLTADGARRILAGLEISSTTGADTNADTASPTAPSVQTRRGGRRKLV